jgi:hypothetical protein
LYLNENKISYIDSSLFKNNNELLVLDLRNNELKTILSDAFKNCRLLSLVLIQNNQVVLNGTSLNSCNTSFNVLDIEFCKSNKTSLTSYQSLPRLQELKRNTSELVPVTGLSQNTELFEVIKYKLEEVSYGIDDYLYYNATPNQIITTSGIPLLCYCERMYVWFWCSEHCPPTVGLTHMYETLKCNKEYGQEIRNQTNGMDSHANKETDQIVMYTLVALALAFLIVTVAVVAFAVRRKCKRATEETECYVARDSFIFQNRRDEGNVYEEIRPVAA